MAETLEARVGQALLRRGWTLALAESCTGGLIGHRLTNVPGSSSYFLGSIVAYAYEAKEHLLGVRHQTLYEHGAVSRETAVEMARGARRSLSADIGLSVTGIAGPGGGLPDKPVGLTWVAISRRDSDRAERYVWSGDRLSNKEQSAEAALELLLEVLADN
ncbi:MAG TPA: CinA family protein [Anaerolineales bacterium]|nr:CinA family protein [Anaerolineales bacterium]